jgi:sulfite reductase beta subunit-like hemoprotein
MDIDSEINDCFSRYHRTRRAGENFIGWYQRVGAEEVARRRTFTQRTQRGALWGFARSLALRLRRA